MMRSLKGLLLLGAVGVLAPACTNPTVDPNATFTAKGVVVDETGAPLVDAEVRLIKYWSDLNVFQPNVETLFADNPNGDSAVGLGVAVVDTARTNSEGEYSFEFLGDDIRKPGGVTTATGEVEVADVVVVVRDPLDTTRQSGVYTYHYLFQPAAKVWDAGELGLWDSQAEADSSDALTSGLVKLSWSKLERSSSTMVRNAYRVWVEPANEPGPRLIIYCNQGDEVEGGCAQDTEDSSKLARYLSAFYIEQYYTDSDRQFAAFVQGNSPDFRFVSRFVVIDPLPDLTDYRDPLPGFEVYAVNTETMESQDLTDSAATDGDAMTRETITIGNADALYVKLVQNNSAPVISDAGILNSLVRNARNGCITLEFTVRFPTDLDGAVAVAPADWTQKGKFCGENGAADEMSAIASFDTTSESGVAAGWMRVTADTGLTFDAVGEVAIYQLAR